MSDLLSLLKYPQWAKALAAPLSQASELEKFLDSEYQNNSTVYPDKELIFNALNMVAPQDIKVVILGQDPYHGKGQAHGLAFSVNKGIKIPPSLRNIYKEIYDDLGIIPPKHGFLQSWAQQGVLLLNTVLTVRDGQAGSHQKHGWEEITDSIIAHINTLNQPVVFMLWGAPAQKKEKLLNNANHLILKAPHPSPLSAHRGFLDCKHFSQANDFLEKKKIKPINWQLD